MFIEPKHTAMFELFKSAGFELRAVGGYVRDRLMGIDPKDVDFCTNATPDQMMVIARSAGITVLPTGVDHGTVTFMVDGEGFEITTLRVDVETDGRHAKVEFTTDFAADAARRDFTINAMSMDADGNIFDYFGGQEDLQNKVIRFVGKAEDRIREDFLRVLRYFRFASRFNAMVDPDTKRVFNQTWVRDGIKQVSKERVWAEFQKILVGPGRDHVVPCIFHCGIAQALGMTHTVQSVWFTKADDAVSALSVFVKDAKAFAADWKMSSIDTRKLVFMVAMHDAAFAVKSQHRKEWIEDQLVNNVPRDWVVSIARMHMENMIEHASTWSIPVFPVKGQDLLDAGHKPSPWIGNSLRQMKDVWVKSRFTLTREELLRM